jgi:hypothetical protein
MKKQKERRKDKKAEKPEPTRFEDERLAAIGGKFPVERGVLSDASFGLKAARFGSDGQIDHDSLPYYLLQ